MTSSKIIEVMAEEIASFDPDGPVFLVNCTPAYANQLLGKAERILTALQASGMAVVPVEPNNTVVTAGCFALDGPAAREALMAAMLSGDRHAVGQTKMRLRWAAMVAAASSTIKAPDREGEQDE